MFTVIAESYADGNLYRVDTYDSMFLTLEAAQEYCRVHSVGDSFSGVLCYFQ